MDVLFKQYELICERRETLFRYCDLLQPVHFIKDLESFGARSIRHVTVYTANNYIFWIGHFANVDNQSLTTPDHINNVSDARELFTRIDGVVDSFLTKYQPDYEAPIINKVPMREFEVSLTALQLFTHVIAHEYHQKSQIISMGRHLGYMPVDTDIMRLG